MTKIKTLAVAAAIATLAAGFAGSAPAEARVSVGNAAKCALLSGGNKAKAAACLGKYHGGKALKWVGKKLHIRL